MSLRRWILLLCVPLLLAGLARAEESSLVTTPGVTTTGDASCHKASFTATVGGQALGEDVHAPDEGPAVECRPVAGSLLHHEIAPTPIYQRTEREDEDGEKRIIPEEAVILPAQAMGVLRMLRIDAELPSLVETTPDDPQEASAVLRLGRTGPLGAPLGGPDAGEYAASTGYGTLGVQPAPGYNGNVATGAYVPFGGAHGVGISSYLPPMPSKEIIVGGILLGFLGLALYQRFTPAAGAQHERRALILNTLMELPEGATAGDVGRLLGMNRKTVDYHLTYLVRLGKIRESIDETGARRYSLRALPERKPLVERTLEVVRSRPGLSILELSETLGVSRSAADRHTKALVIQGVLESRLVDGERRLFMAAV